MKIRLDEVVSFDVERNLRREVEGEVGRDELFDGGSAEAGSGIRESHFCQQSKSAACAALKCSC